MSNRSIQSGTLYEVVVNQETQYSIRPLIKALPLRWAEAGKQGSKEAFLAFISEVWANMRHLSLRQEMRVS
ncbi:MbtH family NRPS accessory protein [Dyella silvatica]|uniref:MbtH family NRPS accessory protein n=1 Tax=Dyella silvatica TaxID=2992128 RepID=UPI002252E242|nr:MbtH family NRPS accessory protein [Dyella silvatica]